MCSYLGELVKIFLKAIKFTVFFPEPLFHSKFSQLPKTGPINGVFIIHMTVCVFTFRVEIPFTFVCNMLFSHINMFKIQTLRRIKSCVNSSVTLTDSVFLHSRCPWLCGLKKDADNKVRRCWRWGGGENVPSHLVHHQCLSRRIHPHRFWQLQCPDECWWTHREPEPVGHSGSGGVRPAAHALLPSDQRVHYLLFYRQPVIICQRPTQVVPGGVAPLPQRACAACGNQARSAQRQRDHQEAKGAEPGSHHTAAGHDAGKADQRREIFGVLRSATGRRQGSFCWGCACRSLSCHQKEFQKMRPLVVWPRGPMKMDLESSEDRQMILVLVAISPFLCF